MGKKQHFVPRLLLKEFATDNQKKHINIYLLERNISIINGYLLGQAYRNNLYGSDQVLEKTLGIIESKFAIVLNKINSNICELTEEDCVVAKIFMIIQMNRTPQAAKDLEESMDGMIHEMFAGNSKVGKFIEKVSLVMSYPYHELFEQSLVMAESIIDLRLGILEASKGNTFVIGEHPVILLNPFLEKRNWLGSKEGLAIKGTVLIMPISPTKAIILFDNIRYKLANMKKSIIIQETDINLINYCEFLYTNNCIYYSGIEKKEYEKYSRESSEYRKESKSVVKNVFENDDPIKKRGKIIMVTNISLPIKHELSFLVETEYGYKDTKITYRNIYRENVKLPNKNG